MKLLSLVAVAAIAVAAQSARGQAPAQPTYKRDLPEALVKQAKVTEAAAAATAQARYPKAKIEGVELEKENGKLQYSYDLKTEGKSGIDEVNVDAITGKIIAAVHESPAAERKEAAEDAKKEAKKAAKPPAAPKKP